MLVAQHYFELSTADLKFIFPQPGRLEGIRTSTQKFLELSNVDYTYPGNTAATLTDVNVKMTLSSRVAVIGANGGEEQRGAKRRRCRFALTPCIKDV